MTRNTLLPREEVSQILHLNRAAVYNLFPAKTYGSHIRMANILFVLSNNAWHGAIADLPLPKLMTPKEAAMAYKMSVRQVLARIKKGVIPHFRLSRKTILIPE